MKTKLIKISLISLVLLGLVIPTAPLGQTENQALASESEITQEPLPEPPSLEFPMPGRIEETGTYFEIKDSKYLSVVLESSEKIKIVLESIPRMISMNISSSTDSTSTNLTISGLEPNKTYYKYQDSYKNEAVFVSNENGSYNWNQDLSQSHHIWFQEIKGTTYIDKNTVLDHDITGSVEITADNITLDCNGHNIMGSDTGYGIYLSHRENVTLKNCNISNNNYGIYLHSSNSNTLTGNTVSDNCDYGIFLRYSSNNNTLTGNTASNNSYGISLYDSGNNFLRNNLMLGSKYNFHIHGVFTNDIDTSNLVDGKPIYYLVGASDTVIDSSSNAGTVYCIQCNNITIEDLNLTNNFSGIFFYNTKDSKIQNNHLGNNSYGLYLYFSSNNTLTGNTASGNSYYGIILSSSNSNTLTSNAASNNRYGIHLYGSNSNTLTGNTASNNRYGIYLDSSSINQIYNNNFINNLVQAYIQGGGGNLFNLEKPVGGNHWSDWTSPDNDGDGFVDYPYVFTGGQDNYPFINENGWEMPPVPLELWVEVNSSEGVNIYESYSSYNFKNIPIHFIFQRTLEKGIGGDDVKHLQIVLNSDSDTKVAESGDGSPGEETNYFGPKTEDAVKRFQEKYASEILAPWKLSKGTGMVGVTTRAKLDALIGVIRHLPDKWILKVTPDTELGDYSYEGDEFVWWHVEDGEISDSIWEKEISGWIAIAPGGSDESEYILTKKGNEAEDRIKEIVDGDKRASSVLEAGNKNQDSFGLNDFPLGLILAIASQESGPYHSWNNTLVSFDGGRGIAQITYNDYVGSGSGKIESCLPYLNISTDSLFENCYGGRCEGHSQNEYQYSNNCELKEEEYYCASEKCESWICNCYHNSNCQSDPYSNIAQGIEANIKDGLHILQEMWTYTEIKYRELCWENNEYNPDKILYCCNVNGCKKAINNQCNPEETEIVCQELGWISTTQRYNIGTGHEKKFTSYIGNIAYHLEQLWKEDHFGDEVKIYVNPDKASELATTCTYASRYAQDIQLMSPGELRVYDPEERISGLLNGEVIEGIPNSIYDEENKILTIFFPFDSYHYEVVGTDEGNYGLTITSVENGVETTFTAIEIPTTASTTHQYTIDWEILSQDGKGVTLQIDADGDGVFEETVVSDSKLTQDEFILQTETIIDYKPDTLNLKSNGKWLTCYIEFPAGYEVADIDVNTILLNGEVAAEASPTEVGDYDEDGISDIMVKFDRSEVQGILEPSDEAELTITGELTDGTLFKGNDTIRVIGKGKK